MLTLSYVESDPELPWTALRSPDYFALQDFHSITSLARPSGVIGNVSLNTSSRVPRDNALPDVAPRLASAAVVMPTVLKVFLLDMRDSHRPLRGALVPRPRSPC
jgi:hypothetical protein